MQLTIILISFYSLMLPEKLHLVMFFVKIFHINQTTQQLSSCVIRFGSINRTTWSHVTETGQQVGHPQQWQYED